MNNKNRVHPHLLNSAAEALVVIFEKGFYADKVIERSLKGNPKWGSRDRKFFAETVYDIVRWWRYLWAIYGAQPSFDSKKIIEIFWIWKHFVKSEIYQGSLNLQILEKNNKLAIQKTAIKESVPDWLYERGASELPKIWDKELKYLNEIAPVVLRTNTLLIDRETLKNLLLKEKVDTSPVGVEGLILKERKNVFITECFKKGFFEVQDGSSQKVAHFLNLKPGMRVVDACAGAGGKSLHIASLLKNKGKVIAMDIEERKLLELKKRAARAKVDVIETRVIESTKTIKRLEETADRLLLDVPCSGIGVLKRNPDSKWKLTLEKCNELLQIQAFILEEYSKMTKKNGVMVYSTCSILPSENSLQIKKFLEKNPNWEFEEENEIFPSQEGFDGFYMARLLRKS